MGNYSDEGVDIVRISLLKFPKNQNYSFYLMVGVAFIFCTPIVGRNQSIGYDYQASSEDPTTKISGIWRDSHNVKAFW